MTTGYRIGIVEKETPALIEGLCHCVPIECRDHMVANAHLETVEEVNIC